MGGGGKETPRQKMIGMMYLVLTALLAMNVSKSVLDAFVGINEGLERTNENFSKANEKTFQSFEAALEKDKIKTQPYFDRAKKAQQLSKELQEYMDVMKSMIIQEVEKLPKEQADTLPLRSIQAKDNYDIPAQVLLGDEANPRTDKYSMTDLKKQLGVLKEEYKKLFDNKDLFLPQATKEMHEKIERGINLENPPPSAHGGATETWETEKVLHVPIAAVIAHLSALQAAVANAEADVVGYLYQAVKGKDFTFDKLVAKVIAPSSYILQGDKYVADVLLVAFNSNTKPKVLVGSVDTTKKPIEITNGKEILVEGGMGKYEVPAGAEGIQKWSGVIQVEKPGGGFESYPFSSEYMVAKPALVVSPTKMNVLYIGPENPLDISVPGIASENLQPSLRVEGGSWTLTGSRGKYIAKGNGGKEAIVSVSAKLGGANKSMGEYKFRVKRVPDPVAKFAGKTGDDLISKGELNANKVVIAFLDNFDFELKFDIVSFDVSAVVKGSLVTYTAKGSKVTSEMENLFKNVATGGKVFIEAVKAKGPDGSVRKIPGLNLKVKS